MNDEMPTFVTAEQFQPVAEDMKKVKGKLFGNGEPGWDESIRKIPEMETGIKELKTAVQTVQTYIDSEKDKDAKRAELWKQFRTPLITVGVGLTVGFFIQFFVFWVKVAPFITSP